MANFDPNKVLVSYKGHIIQGFAAGSFIVVERDSDSYTKKKGANGDVTRIRNRDRSGMATMTLMAESPSNDVLSAFLALDELVGDGEGPFQVVNFNSTSLASSSDAWIRKFANLEGSDAGSDNIWIIDMSDLDIFVGGSIT